MTKNRTSAFGTVAGFGLAFGVVLALFFGVWWPVITGSLSEVQRIAFRQVATQAAAPLAKAVGTSDDLSRVDVLKWLQGVPGVVSAALSNSPAKNGVPLIWSGRTVGYLELQMSKAFYQRCRYRLLERCLTLVALAVLLGAGIGFAYVRHRRTVYQRSVLALKRQKSRAGRNRERLQNMLERRYRSWLEQGLSFTQERVLLLDSEQRLVAANLAGRKEFGLASDATGKNWLELVQSPRWIGVLRETLETPGRPVEMPKGAADKTVRLLTCQSPEPATWISVG